MSLKKPNFHNIRILLADSDPYLSKAVADSLRAFGFTAIEQVRTGQEALTSIRLGLTDLLITEWGMKGVEGIDLIRFVRRSPESPNRTLPIIMLTGRGELPEVIIARDAGTTEFVVKPFTIQTLYQRIEQMVDRPRNFVLTQQFVGPDRRRPNSVSSDVPERRTQVPKVMNASRMSTQHPPEGSAMIFAPDFSLKRSLGLDRPLAQFITPEVLSNAQKVLDTMADETMSWAREEIQALEKAHAAIEKLYSVQAFDTLKEGSLTIKSRAGTFGYKLASDVARLLYLFLSVDFLPTHPRHLIVIQKYIEALKVIFAQGIKERSGIGAELYLELERLTALRT